MLPALPAHDFYPQHTAAALGHLIDSDRAARRSERLSFAAFTAIANVNLAPPLAPQPRPDWRNDLALNTQRVLKLTAGWDGYSSVPIRADLLQYAAILVNTALEGSREAVAPYLVPGGDGSIQIEWHKKAGELELDIDLERRLYIWGRNHNTGAEYEGEDDLALALFYRWAPWVAAVTGDAPHVLSSAAGPLIAVAA